MMTKSVELRHLDFNLGKIFVGSLILFALLAGGCGSREEDGIEIQPSQTEQPISTPSFLPTKSSTPPWTQTPILPTSTPILDTSSSMISDKDGMTLVYVPAGKFAMGMKAEDALAECQKFSSDCQLDWFHDEEPPHTVSLDAYWIDQTEVTNAMYAKCVQSSECDLPGSTKSFAGDSYYGEPEFDQHPVIFVSWEDAASYCSWAGRRLPTEAEWEKAARGEKAFLYPWGNADPDKNLLNYNAVLGNTTAVGNYPNGASPYGAMDMAGNVLEWVADWYHPDYYINSPSFNPLGPASGEARVLRGGSWLDTGMGLLSAIRGGNDPTLNYDLVGFRCAMSAAP